MESLEGHFSMVHCSGCPGGEWEPRNRPRGGVCGSIMGPASRKPDSATTLGIFLVKTGTRATSGAMQPSIDLRLVKGDNNRPSLVMFQYAPHMIVLNTYRCLFRRVFVVSWFHKRHPSIPICPSPNLRNRYRTKLPWKSPSIPMTTTSPNPQDRNRLALDQKSISESV